MQGLNGILTAKEYSAKGRGAGIVLVSSDYAELLGMCDRILIMRNGALIADCSASDVLASNRLSAFIE